MTTTLENQKRAVLSLGGPLAPEAVAFLRQDAARADLLVGVDGGARHLLALELLPQIVTGDFDSLGLEEREDLAARGVKIVATPDQDYTDCDKALSYVLDTESIASVRLYAGTGGRLDHLYSVLSAVTKHTRLHQHHSDIRLADEWGETWLCPPHLTLTGDDLIGRTVSFMALGTVHGFTTSGVRWPLDNETLAPGVRDATLNEVIAPTVTVTHTSGDLFIMLHHGTG